MLSSINANPLPEPMEQVDLSHPITEDDIANFLLASPDFFVRHAEVLATVQIASPHGSRAVGLQQRQAEMLREKIKGLEARIVDMVGHAHDNAQLADKVEQLCCDLLHVEQADELPQRLLGELAQRFDMPQVALRLWDVDARFAQSPFAQDVGDDARAFAASMRIPFCGLGQGLPVVHWLAEPDSALSVALVPLRWPVAAPVDATLPAAPIAAALDVADSAAHSLPGQSARQHLPEDPMRREPTFGPSHDERSDAAVMPDASPAASAAALPERPVSGLLVLASPDAKRFHADMGTDLLQRLGDLCSAALSRLRPADHSASASID